MRQDVSEPSTQLVSVNGDAAHLAGGSTRPLACMPGCADRSRQECVTQHSSPRRCRVLGNPMGWSLQTLGLSLHAGAVRVCETPLSTCGPLASPGQAWDPSRVFPLSLVCPSLSRSQPLENLRPVYWVLFLVLARDSRQESRSGPHYSLLLGH